MIPLPLCKPSIHSSIPWCNSARSDTHVHSYPPTQHTHRIRSGSSCDSCRDSSRCRSLRFHTGRRLRRLRRDYLPLLHPRRTRNHRPRLLLFLSHALKSPQFGRYNIILSKWPVFQDYTIWPLSNLGSTITFYQVPDSTPGNLLTTGHHFSNPVCYQESVYSSSEPHVNPFLKTSTTSATVPPFSYSSPVFIPSIIHTRSVFETRSLLPYPIFSDCEIFNLSHLTQIYQIICSSMMPISPLDGPFI